MFGKHFASMYSGSMIGAGAVVFAVMGYVIANTKPDKQVGGQVELNADLLAVIIGEPVKEIEKALEFLCKPDPKSRTPDHAGRRLIQLGPYDYQVVNWPMYRAIKDEETRREQNRISQERRRKKQKSPEPLCAPVPEPIQRAEKSVKDVNDNVETGKFYPKADAPF